MLVVCIAFFVCIPFRSAAYTDVASGRIASLVQSVGIEIPEFRNDTIVETGRFGGYPLNVEIIAGVVCHIGLNIFGCDGKNALGKHLSEFVERYLLYILTIPDEERDRVLSEDGVTISGNLQSIPTFEAGTCNLSLTSIDNQTYRLEWGCDGGRMFSIGFPAECELIYGMDKRELEQFFRFELEHHRFGGNSIASDNTDRIRLSENLYYDDRGNFTLEGMKQGLYYRRIGDSYSIFCDTVYIAPSIHNMMTEPSLSREITAEVSLHQYGFKTTSFSISLGNLLDLCLEDGCEPYVGFELNDRPGLYSTLIVMANRAVGYNHLIKVSFPAWILGTGKGTVPVEINAFVPTHNLKNLYDDNNEKRHVGAAHKLKL